MTRAEAIELQEAFNHFADGGELWYCNTVDWLKQTALDTKKTKYTTNIIEDKHFEARKAHALGKEVDIYYVNGNKWVTIEHPTWLDNSKYRPKPNDVYEWFWLMKLPNGYTTVGYATEELAAQYKDWEKFEPSKRIKK